jgi:hypothetical protein
MLWILNVFKSEPRKERKISELRPIIHEAPVIINLFFSSVKTVQMAE